MTTTPGWKVVGFVGASATAPAFVLPVLRRDGGNSLVLQRIDEHGRISEFEPLDDDAADTVTHVHSPFQRHIGDPPLWAFRLTPDDHLVAEQPELRAYLAERLDAPELRAAPLVRLRVIQFIGRDDLLTDALRDAYALMQTLPDGTARFWRDNVVLAQRCRDVLREKGIPEDTINTEVREGVLWIYPLDDIADGVDWAQALKLYVDAFALTLGTSNKNTKEKHTEKYSVIIIKTPQQIARRILISLNKRKLPGGCAIIDQDSIAAYTEYKSIDRAYVFADGREGLSARILKNLRPAVTPTPIHLIWADSGRKLPTEEHEEAVDAITLLLTPPQWPREGTLNNPEPLSTLDRRELFLHMAAANKFEHEPCGTFVATRHNPRRLSGHHDSISAQTETSTIFIPPQITNQPINYGYQRSTHFCHHGRPPP